MVIHKYRNIRIKDIAKIANVSRGTVDKVLNNRKGVSDAVRKRVKDIAKAVNYKPHMAAKALSYNNKPFLIGVIVLAGNNDFFPMVQEGLDKISEELNDFGCDVECITMNSLYECSEQVNIIDYFKKKGVAGLVLTALDTPEIRQKINDLVDSGIPVVTMNSDIPDSKRLCFVGQDTIKSGKIAADLMGKLLNRKGKVVLFTGSFHMMATNNRLAGFNSIIKSNYPEIEIIDIKESNGDDETAFKKMCLLLKENEDINGVYLAADGVHGVCRAIRLNGLQGKIKVVCNDFMPDIIEALKEGIIDFTIGQDPFSQGYNSVKILFDYIFHGKKVEDQYFRTSIDIRTRENIDIA